MVDEEALLAQFTARFDQDAEHAVTAQTDETASDETQSDAEATFDTDRFLQGLDAIFARHTAASEAAPYLWDSTVPKAGMKRTSGSCNVPSNWPCAWAWKEPKSGPRH